MNNDKAKYQPPEPDSDDMSHALAKGTLGAIPVIGTMASEWFAQVFGPPIQRRMLEWQEAVAGGLLALEGRLDGFDIKALAENENFLSAYTITTRRALETASADKRQALLNGLLNIGAGMPIPDAEQQAFLGYVDRFNVWHLRLLDLLSDPIEFGRRYGIQWPDVSLGSPNLVVEGAWPELCGHAPTYEQYSRELNSEGLLNGPSFSLNITGTSIYQRCSTPRGEQFLSFVRPPRL